jgi:hypothetical protein
MIYKDKIGYLDYSIPINFNDGHIYPLDNFDKINSLMKEKINEDGFIYPPIINIYRQYFEEGDGKLKIKEELIPRTKRPAEVFKIYPSHEIQIDTPIFAKDPRTNDGFFITCLIAFMFGVRLQIHDCWIDGRVPVAINCDFIIKHAALEEFIELAYRSWRSSSDEGKRLLNNILYMQTRIKTYECDWEKFIIAYMVFDGCYKFLELNGKIPSKSYPKHKERLQFIIKHFGMETNNKWIEQITKLRNNLFHEVLWGEGEHCFSGSTDTYRAMRILTKFNSRVIISLLGYKGKYTQSAWWKLDDSMVFF